MLRYATAHQIDHTDIHPRFLEHWTFGLNQRNEANDKTRVATQTFQMGGTLMIG